MSTKHNVSHKARFGRGRSHYPESLLARGLGKSPTLRSLDALRSLHAARIREHGHPWPAEFHYPAGNPGFYITEDGIPLAVLQ